MLWKIWYREYPLPPELPALYIKADSFDEALAEARKKDPRYDTGQFVKE